MLSLFYSVFSAAAIFALSTRSFRNPVIPGFHPDPSCIRVEDTFFCATSSFNAFPGIPVFASKDLVNFKQIGNVINRQTQLPGLAHTNGSTSGMWAPSLRYHDGTFWVITTLVYDHLPQTDASRWDNVIFKTTDIFSDSWSDPVHFSFEGYDTSPFWTEDGKSYIQGSHAWHVRPVIQGFEIDLETGQMGTVVDLWNGTGGLAPEAPHLFSKDGFYYLMIAEGGTGLNHMVTMARSRSIWGPFEPNPSNPVLTNANTSQYFQTVGHADLFSDSNGNWWAVALSTRSGPDFTFFPMGRETVLTPVTWKPNQWPTFTPVRGQETGPLPPTDKNIKEAGTWIGTSEHLTFPPGSSLPPHFVYNRLPDPTAYAISPAGHPHTLRLRPSLLNLTGLEGRLAATPQTFVGRRQEHVQFLLDVELDFRPEREGEEAGVSVFLNQAQHFDLGVVALARGGGGVSVSGDGGEGGDVGGVSRYVRLRTVSANATMMGGEDTISRPGMVPLPDGSGLVRLQVEAVNSTWYAFRASTGGEWVDVGYGVSSEVSGGFTGTILGMFATGNGEEGPDMAYFSEFSYIGNEDVF